MIFKNLLRRKARTLLTVLGVSLGVAAIIGLGSLANGMSAGYTSMLSGARADLLLTQKDVLDISLSSIDQSIGDEVGHFPEVEEIAPMVEGYVQTDGAPYFFIFGFEPGSFPLERFGVSEGFSFDNLPPRQLRGKPVLLGSAAAESLKKKVGDTIRLGNSSFRVVGIYSTGDAFEDGGAVFKMEDAQELLSKPRRVSLFYIKLKDPSMRASLEERITRKWDDLSASGTSEFADTQMMATTMGAFTWAIAGMAILLGGVGMMNAQLMAVYERTREIGVLRAVGWSSRQVMLLILGESLVVCLLGGALGMAMGWLVVDWVSSSTVMMGMDTSNINAGLISQAVITVVIMGLAAGLYPAYRASQLQPIEALRYEGGSGSGGVKRLPVGGMAVQSLWQRTTRTLLTFTVIALTVGSIIAMDALVDGAFNQFNNMAAVADAEIVVRQADIADTSLSAVDERAGDRIAALPEVQYVNGMAFTAVAMPESGGFFVIMGYAPRENAIRKFKLTDGQVLTNNHQIMLGRMTADAMNKKVGDSINISGTRFRIVGIYETGVSWEEMGGVITLRDAQTFMQRPRKVTLYTVKVKDPRQAQAVADRINATVSGVNAALSADFTSSMPEAEATDAMISGISLLAIVVGGMGVMNTMLMSVLERTREIGVLRAVGWRRKAVLGIILQESFILSISGGLGGILVALLLGLLLKAVPMFGEALSPAWGAASFVRAIFIALTLGLVGGLYPALRATRMQPIEALRYE